MSLTEELETVRLTSRKNTPSDVFGAYERDIADLSRSGIADRSLKVGDKAPLFSLPDESGREMRLADLLAEGPVVLDFFRGNWCPFCLAELQAFQNALPAIRALGAQVVAISPQTPDRSLCTAEQNCLGFEVLSDVHNKVARKFGIAYHLRDEMQSIYREFGLDLPEYNGDESFDLPVPATYVIDSDGVIRLAFVDPDYTNRLDPAEVLSALRRLKTSA